MKEKIGLVGPGKLGLCVSLLLEGAGFDVTAIENNAQYLEGLRSKSLDTSEPQVSERLATSKIHFDSNLDELMEDGVDTILVYVPTPDSPEGYDHGILESVLKALIEFGNRPSPVTVMIGCTTLPGFCQSYKEDLAALNFRLVYSPSFIAQGSIIQNLQHPDILLFGSDSLEASKTCMRIMKSITVNDPQVHSMDILSAEITKLATNCFLTAKIAFANSIGDLAIKSGANQEAILDAVGSDNRIGKSYLKYGFGYGGPCFPRDNRALKYFADQKGFELSISVATEKSNLAHSDFQIQKYLGEYGRDEVVHFDHVTYKPDSDILEESQQLKVAVALAKSGRKVSVGGVERVIKKLKAQFGDLFQYVQK